MQPLTKGAGNHPRTRLKFTNLMHAVKSWIKKLVIVTLQRKRLAAAASTWTAAGHLE